MNTIKNNSPWLMKRLQESKRNVSLSFFFYLGGLSCVKDRYIGSTRKKHGIESESEFINCYVNRQHRIQKCQKKSSHIAFDSLINKDHVKPTFFTTYSLIVVYTAGNFLNRTSYAFGNLFFLF